MLSRELGYGKVGQDGFESLLRFDDNWRDRDKERTAHKLLIRICKKLNGMMNDKKKTLGEICFVIVA